MNSLIKKLSVTVAALAALTTTSMAAEGTVTAEGSLRLREESNTSSAILTTLPGGAVVDVSAVTEGGWFKVSYDGKTGFVSGDYLSVGASEVAQLPVIFDPCYGQVVAGPLNVRSGPSTDSAPVNILNKDSVVVITEKLEGWYQVEDGYVSAQYVEVIDEATAAELRTSVSYSNSSLGQKAVEYAMQFLGYRYVYGGASPSTGFDCSGLTSYVYKNALGVSINRTSRDQFSNGTYVDKANLQAGDLLFFANSGTTINHVGMYIGNNQFIHASSPTTGIIISSLSESFYVRTYYGARRIV